jgi:hypothetical protein
MLRARQMTFVSRKLSNIIADLSLPDDVHLTTDIDPVDMA